MATVDPVEITPTLQNCSITEPAKSSDGGYYLSPSQLTVTLKADTGYIFESDGALTYQTSSSSTVPLDIKATKTDTATVTLPSTISWDDNFSFPLTMSAVKAPTTTPTKPTKPTTPTKPAPTTPVQPAKPTTPAKPAPTTPAKAVTTPTSTVPKTQLDVLKNSLRVPLDVTDDDTLLQSYLDSATEYLASTLDDENMTRLDSKRAKVIINEIATLLYQNRGDETVVKDFPFSLRALLNQLKY